MTRSTAVHRPHRGNLPPAGAEQAVALATRPSELPDHGQRPVVVLSSVSSDAHTWNLVYLQLLLEEIGWQVVNLGACTPDPVVLEACERHGPDLVVISTVNGHGHLDGARLAAALRSRPALAGVPAVIGGKLGVHGALDGDMAAALLDAGFDAVFDDSEDQRAFTSYVAELALDSGRAIA